MKIAENIPEAVVCMALRYTLTALNNMQSDTALAIAHVTWAKQLLTPESSEK